MATLLGIFAAALVTSWIGAVFIPFSKNESALPLSIHLFIRESAALAALVFFAARYLKITASELGLTRLHASHVIVGIASAVAFMLTISQILARTLPPPVHSEFIEALHGSPVASQLLLLAMVGIYSPIVQELVFRGLLLNGLMQRLSVPIAILVSSIFFAATHAQSGVRATVSNLFFGMVTGYLYARTRSLTASIVCHVILNTLPLAIAILMPVSSHH